MVLAEVVVVMVVRREVEVWVWVSVVVAPPEGYRVQMEVEVVVYVLVGQTVLVDAGPVWVYVRVVYGWTIAIQLTAPGNHFCPRTSCFRRLSGGYEDRLPSSSEARRNEPPP